MPRGARFGKGGFKLNRTGVGQRNTTIPTTGTALNINDTSFLFYVDPANTASYPGTGTTANDLTGRGNVLTFSGGADWVSDNGGLFRMTGSPTYFYSSNSGGVYDVGTGDFTMSMWINWQSGGYKHWMAFDTQNTFALKSNNATPSSLYFYGGAGYTGTAIGVSLSPNTWYNITFVRSGLDHKFYINNVLEDTHVETTNKNLSGFGNLNIGFGQASEYSASLRGPHMLWKRALTDTEVTEVWDASRARYGL